MPTGYRPDTLVDAIEAALEGQTLTGAGGFTLKLKQATEPTDISSGGQSWETGVFVVLDDIEEVEPGSSGSPLQWYWKANIEVQITFRRPPDATLRQGNMVILRRKVMNLIDQALMNAGSGTTCWPMRRRRLPPLGFAPGTQEFYLIRVMFDVGSFWDHS